jgi:hypothetical protein
VPGSPQGRAGLPGAVVGVAQHLKTRLLIGEQLDPGGPIGGGGGGQRTLGHQPRGGLGGDMGLVAVALVGAAFPGVARLRVDGGDDPVFGDPAGDPPRAGPLARLDVLACHQRQQRDRLGLLVVQPQVGDRLQHGQRVVDQPRDQRLLGLGVVPGTLGLARPLIVMRGQRHLAGAGHQPADPADRRHQLRDRVLGGDRYLKPSWLCS